MGQPVKLSDELVDDARTVISFSQRSIAGHPDLICRIEEDGRETVGRFVGREFKVVEVDR